MYYLFYNLYIIYSCSAILKSSHWENLGDVGVKWIMLHMLEFLTFCQSLEIDTIHLIYHVMIYVLVNQLLVKDCEGKHRDVVEEEGTQCIIVLDIP